MRGEMPILYQISERLAETSGPGRLPGRKPHLSHPAPNAAAELLDDDREPRLSVLSLDVEYGGHQPCDGIERARAALRCEELYLAVRRERDRPARTLHARRFPLYDDFIALSRDDRKHIAELPFRARLDGEPLRVERVGERERRAPASLLRGEKARGRIGEDAVGKFGGRFRSAVADV